MSKYEWERADILIPSAEWADFKSEIREAWNSMQERRYNLALKVWKHIKKEGKGKRGFDYHEAAREAVKRFARRRDVQDSSFYQDIRSAIFVRRDDQGRLEHRDKPLKPRKKDFPTKSNRDNEFHFGDATIRFDNDERTLRWSVAENNHAVERSREHPVAKAMFKALRQVDWTRNSGGVFRANDEYNRESGKQHAGAGGSYVNSAYGPRGEEVAGYRTDQIQKRSRRSRRW